jgi:amidase
MSDIWRLTATELARKIAARNISAVEAARAALDRLAAVNPRINAVVAHDPAGVLAQAKAVDAAIGRGETPGILAGVPVTVKVNIDQAGFATTNGTVLQKDLMARTNSPVVDNLRRAGAVILGRTNTPAFSLRWFTSNLLHGATKNPRDASLTPGGSSGGAAASVAAGIGHLAHGTDIAGSIRYPAYACGVHGLRPSLGRVAAYNASSPERSIGAQLTAVSGPIARGIADLRLGLAALSGADARDPWWVPAPLKGPDAPLVAALCLRPGGMVIAPEIEAVLLDAAARLRDAGWRVEDIADVPHLQEAAKLQTVLWLGDRFAQSDALAAQDGDPGAAAVMNFLREAAMAIAPADVTQALIRRATLIRDWQLFLQAFPVLLLPVSAELPFPDDLDRVDFARVWAAQLTQIGLPLLGLPALSVAIGLAGVQIVAGRFREDLCLAAGEAIEARGGPISPVEPAG